MNNLRATRSKIPSLTAIESAQNSQTPPRKTKKKDQSEENKQEAKEDEEIDLSQALDLDQSQLLMISQVPETEENEGM